VTPPDQRGHARALAGLVRPFTLLAPAVGAGCGAAAALAATGAAPPWGTLGLGLLAALAATGASNAWNQAFDAPLDRMNKPSRAIPAGLATERGALLLGHGLAALALAAAALATPVFLACLATGVLATWIYSAPPLRTKRSLAGALVTIAVPRGFLVPVAGWSLVAPPETSDPWALGAVVGLFVLGAAATKDFADVEGDRAHGCRTLPVVLGPRRAARAIAPFLVLPFALHPLFALLGWLGPPVGAFALLGGALAVLGLLTARSLLADPARLTIRERNHPAWRAMYLLLLAAHLGYAAVYGLYPGPYPAP
jgi:4-hydroxybenzoate polyprenyltransferase